MDYMRECHQIMDYHEWECHQIMDYHEWECHQIMDNDFNSLFSGYNKKNL